MKRTFRKVSFICLLTLLVLPLFPTKVDAVEIVKQQLGGKGYKESEDLGSAAYSVAVTSAAFGEKDGLTYGYTVANGGILNVVNAETNDLVYNKAIADLNTVWSHALTTDGILYIAGLDFDNKGVLYSFNTETYEITKYGNLAAGKQYWSTTLDEYNNLYIGTYAPGSNGSVIKFDHVTKEFTDLGVIVPNNDADYVRSMAYHDGYLYLGVGLQGRVIKYNLATGQKTDISDGAYDLIGRPEAQVIEKPAPIQAAEGQQYLYTIDNSATENLAIGSKKYPVNGLKNYKATVQMNVTGRGASFYLRFYGATGNYITDQVTHVQNSVAGWKTVTVEDVVPSNATHFSVVMGSSLAWTNGGAHFDDIKLYDKDTQQYVEIENAGFELGDGKNIPGFEPISTTTVAVDYKIQNNIIREEVSSIPTLKFVYDMAIIDDVLIARFDADYRNILMFYDLETQTWVNKIYQKEANNTNANNQGAFGWNTLQKVNGKTYISYNYALHELDLTTFELTPVTTKDNKVVEYRTAFRGFGTIDGTKFVTVNRSGNLQVFDTIERTLTTHDVVMQATPLTLHNLAKDNDGNLYMTTYPGGPRGAKYNIVKESFTSYAQGQAEGIVAGDGDNIYFGFYPGASIQVMNTKTMNTETLFNLKDDYGQDRPYIMEFIDGKLYIGTIPDYGKLGSTLTIYDPTTKDLKVYKDPIKDQSIVGIVKVGDKLIASTTIHGGLQTTPTADEAVIFQFDLNSETVVKQTTLDIPGLGKTPHISGLTLDDDGTLWGIADGIIFTLNPETLEVIKYKDVYPDVRNYGRWRPMNIEFGDGGLLYANIGGKMTVIDPSTENWDHITLDTKPIQFFTLSENKEGRETLYVLEDSVTNLIRFEIVDGGVVERAPEIVKHYVDVINPSFEDDLTGWNVVGGTDTVNTSAIASSERVTDGSFALKIVDKTPTNTIFMQSSNIEVIAGETYTATVDVNIETGQTSMYFRFYDINGKQTHKDVDNVNIIPTRGSDRGWVTISSTMIAPEGSVYAVIGLGTNNYAETDAVYYDNVKVYSQEIIQPIELAFNELSELVATIQNEIESNELETSLYTEESWNRLEEALVDSNDVIERYKQTNSMLRSRIVAPTLEEIEGSLLNLKDARANLVLCDNSDTGEIPPVDSGESELPETGIQSFVGYGIVFIALGGYLFSRRKEA